MKPFIRSEPIPEVNDEPVKVVVRHSLQDVVFNSGKNGLCPRLFFLLSCGFLTVYACTLLFLLQKCLYILENLLCQYL